MDSDLPYQVIFRGKLREGFAEQEVKETLADKLKLPEKEQNLLFSGKPLVLKRTASHEEAQKAVAILTGLGAIVQIHTSDNARKEAGKHAAEAEKSPSHHKLHKFSPYPRGPKLVIALITAASAELFFNLIYALLLITFSVGLVYYNLFSTWAAAYVGFAPLALLVQIVLLGMGLVLLFLIAKPLLSIRPEYRRGILLTEEKEPDLHAFVQDVCERIGARAPSEIRINNDIDVKLFYRQGPIDMLRRRSVLTIGAPLVAYTDTSQLAALVAQSVQVFHSRNLSPTAAYLLHSSDAWLQRACYGQDIVDRELEDMISEESPFTGLARALQKAISLSRKVQGLRLWLSRGINRRLIQRLVADADKVTLVFTGSKGFRNLVERQRLLAFANESTHKGLRDYWLQQGSLPDNIIQTVVMQCRKYPDTVYEQLRLTQEKEKSLSGDTVPTDRQRLKRVSKMEVEAAYRCTSPSTILFRNFSKLASYMTLRYYHNRLQLPVTPDRMTAVTPGDKKVQKVLDEIFQHIYCDFIPLKLCHHMRIVTDYDTAVEQYYSALQEISESRSHAELAIRHCTENEQMLAYSSTQLLIYKADLWRQWGMEKLDHDEQEQLYQSLREQEKSLEESIDVLVRNITPYVQRLAASLAILDTEQASKVKHAAALQQEVTALCQVLDAIEKAQPQLRDLQLHTNQLQTLLSYENGKQGKLLDSITEQSDTVHRLLAALAPGFKNTPYPFKGKESHSTLMGAALHSAYRDEDAAGEFDRGNQLVNKVTLIERRILARLGAIALHVEKALEL